MGSSQLDRQRQSVQVKTELGHREAVFLAELKAGVHRRRPVDEQRDRIDLHQLGYRALYLQVRNGKRLNLEDLLRPHAQRLATGYKYFQLGAMDEELQ